MAVDLTRFKDPEAKYRLNPITHHWPEDRKLLMRAIKDYGYGGVVTNVPFENGFTFNPDNLAEFEAIIKDLEEAGLGFWIYDENGYPSGIGDGKTLVGHPELEAKGLYMRRFVAYEPRRVNFWLDDESDKIVWAAKYPLKINFPSKDESILVSEHMEAVPFSATRVSCELQECEILCVFCVKSAYEGSHLTHNVASFSRYINIMDPRAVRRFIDLCYEPIARAIPDAYRKAAAVFTDEPSLETTYVRDSEVWPYALAPWVDGLFEEFEAEYGFSLLPQLPFLFEGRMQDCCNIRVQFYKLVGKLVAHAYSGQLSEWCRARGGTFSGHYCTEDQIAWHVRFYGDLMAVMMRADYPGIDVLVCIPEYYGGCSTIKYTQMVVRKKATNGMMVELNPWMYFDEFKKSPLENIIGTLNLLYLGGVRVVNSYFYSDYSDYEKDLKGELGVVPTFEQNVGFTGRSDSIWLNEYAGRICYMLDNMHNHANTFVYYALEDVQAKLRPMYSSGFYTTGPEVDADKDTELLIKAVYEAGHDYYFADKDDLASAAESLACGRPVISGCEVKTVIVPALDVMYGESLQALAKLSDAGVNVLFHTKLPTYGTGTVEDISVYTGRCTPCTTEFILESLKKLEDDGEDFSARVIRVYGADSANSVNGADSANRENNVNVANRENNVNVASETVLLKARYYRDGQEMHFVCNNSRVPADVLFEHKRKNAATLYNPADGSVTAIRMGETFPLPSFRGVFVVFD